MFSEELSGNASRKRAEENRARRRRLKEQQHAKPTNKATTQGLTSTSPSSFAIAVSPHTAVHSITAPIAGSNANLLPSTSKATFTPQAFVLTAPPPSATSPALSAVERADQQRRIRAEISRQNKAAVTIQSAWRCTSSNAQLRQELTQKLQQRLQDLSTLIKLLQQKASSSPTTPYVPPPETATSLVQLLLFVSHPRPYVQRNASPVKQQRWLMAPISGWCHFLDQILEYCVLPGMSDPPTNFDLLLWMESPAGRRRLTHFLRLVVAATFSAPIVDVSAIELGPRHRFLRNILGVRSADSSPTMSLVPLVQYCRALLLPKAVSKHFDPPTTGSVSKTSQRTPWMELGASLDVIACVRYHLLFLVAGPLPIPANAQDLRDQCVSQPAKTRAGSLFTLVLDGVDAGTDITEKQLLQSRVVVELLTVPLLSWKVCPATVSRWITPPPKTGGGGPIALQSWLASFVQLHPQALASGALDHLLQFDDLPLTVCPATPSQCLLANLVQLAVECPALNALVPSKLNGDFACEYFTLVASLLDAVPLSTFSSRDSSVEWMTDGKGLHTPIVLSSVILEHCKLLLLDSFVRRLFNVALRMNDLDVDGVLATKNEKDLKHEKELLDGGGTTSASSLAAKEARMDRNRSFWISSKWARKITKGVSALLTGDPVSGSTPSSSSLAAATSTSAAGTVLVNTSSLSRKLAGGQQSVENTPVKQNDFPLQGRQNPEFLYALCRMYAIVLARWGGGGHDDIVRARTSTASTKVSSSATSSPEVCTIALLNVLGFSTSTTRASWAMLQSDMALRTEVETLVDVDSGTSDVRTRSLRPTYGKYNKTKTPSDEIGPVLLFMFVSTLTHVLIVTDDVEIHDMDRPVPLHQLRRCIELLKKLLYRACCLDGQPNAVLSNYFGLSLVSTSSRLMRDLYDRSSRRPMCIPKLWLIPDLFEKEIRQCKSYADYADLLSFPVLRVCPFLVSFKRRLKIFERIVATNRIEVQGVNDLNPFNPNPLKPGIPVRITRGRLLEDGLATMNHLGKNMRRRIAVQYVNEAGVQESGVDAGGLFKEFWTDLSGIAFDPNYALFRVTEGAGNCLYPNPSSGAAHGTDHVVLFEFLGRILGKALYEGITIHPRFAHFFLSFLRGDYNYLHMLPDLSTIDPQLYNNLMFLKTYDGDASDLCLTFTVTSDEFGGTKEIPLISNGANVEVNNTNKQRYIGLVAKHYVVDRVREQSESFTRGLWEVIDRSWLRIFNEPELQVLISGSSDGKLDVDDMRANTKYVGGYTGLDRNITRFWSVVSSLESNQQQSLLRFVTSCERPPPLGFASMNPTFTIQRVGLTRDDEKLPTASTCFNTLKLPIYSSEKVMKERLLYAIQSGAGFELT